jgi:hypothetical protein
MSSGEPGSLTKIVGCLVGVDDDVDVFEIEVILVTDQRVGPREVR